MLMASNAQEHERAAVAQRYRLDEASSKINAEVSALGDQARQYVITGDTTNLSAYQGKLAALRAIEDRIRHIGDAGAGPDEMNALADAMRWADTLHDEQAAAIAARQQGDGDRARRILFGPTYERDLSRVAADIERFQYRLDQRTGADIAAATVIARMWKTSSEIVLGITGLLFLGVLFFVFRQRVLRPVVRLSDVVSRLAAQDYAVEAPDYNQIDEIGDMAQAIRVFRENGIERQRLEEERNADQTLRSLLSRMTQRMQGCDTVHALDRVVESFIPQIAPGLAGRLYLLDEGRRMLVETCAWLGPVHSRPEFLPVACWALQRGDLHRPAGCEVDVRCDHLLHVEQALDTVCLPLIAQRTTLGLLYLEPRHDLEIPPAEMPEIYLRALAENIGLALGNLRLRDALREMAMADPLTGLANRRHLEIVLEERRADADRLSHPISCLMLDIDHFKRFNDEFGHDAGDAVLRDVAGVLKQAMRAGDLACRYGGEEFVLLMPDLDAEQAPRRAEEIRSIIGSLRIRSDGRELGPITASFGVASAPTHCAFGGLLQTADAALLRAKNSGRDRVVTAAGRQSEQRADWPVLG
jgi:diguanylate cyclase (GGDEF)-like protein